LGDEIKEDKMGGALDTYRGEDKCVQVLVGRMKRERQTGRHLLR
jgi:hypothetical protein